MTTVHWCRRAQATIASFPPNVPCSDRLERWSSKLMSSSTKGSKSSLKTKKLLTGCLSEITTHLCFLMYLTTASLWPRCSCTWPSSWSPRARNRQLPSPFHGYLEIWHKPKIFLLPPGICFRESPKVPSCLFRLRKSSKPPSMAACLSFLFLLLERKRLKPTLWRSCSYLWAARTSLSTLFFDISFHVCKGSGCMDLGSNRHKNTLMGRSDQ